MHTGCERGAAMSAPSSSPRGVEVEEAVLREVRPSIVIPAVVEAAMRIDLAFRVDGFAESFLVEEGDRVEVGQVLAELDRDELQRDLRAARASLTRAEANSRDAELRYQRQVKLLSRESTSTELYESALSRREILMAEQAEAQVRVEAAVEHLADAVLRAPVSGYVERRLLEPHEFASARTPVLVLTQLDTVTARAAIADSEIAQLQKGGPALVRIPSSADRVLRGTVVRIAVSADPSTRTVPVEVEVENPDLLLRAEQVVEIEIPIGEPQLLLLVPMSAVLRDVDRSPFCFMAIEGDSGTLAERRRVQIGALYAERVEVTSGLAPGETVIVRGQHFLRDGDPLAVAEEDESDHLDHPPAEIRSTR